VVSATDYSELSKEEQKLSHALFLPSECDCKIRATWFYDLNEDTLKSVDELFGMYEMSVGHGSNFLLNIGPDNRGLLPDADAKRLLELGERIRASFGKPLPYTEPQKDGDIYTMVHTEHSTEDWMIPREERLSNCLMIKEDLTGGQSVRSFRIYGYLPHYQHKKILLFEGRTIGHKVYCRFGAIRCSKFEVEITDHDGDYALKEIKAFYIR
jgi:alpha-L-fucosidase